MKKTIKSSVLILSVLMILLILTGCGNQNVDNTTQNEVNDSTNTVEEEASLDIDFISNAEKQMSMPEEGEEIAIIKIKGYGEVKVKFFQDIAPKAIENFITHAKEGYYNGLTFHRVINEFMIQGGDPEGTGTGGESIWGEGFEEEIEYELVPYRGSLCMASAGTGTSSLGSQFFITQANYSEEMAINLEQAGYPESLIEQYKIYGGYLSLYLNYTVFGQVFEGMDIVDEVAAVQTDEDDKPLTDVIIESIQVTTY